MATDPVRPLPDWTRQDGRDCDECEHSAMVVVPGGMMLRCDKLERAASVARAWESMCGIGAKHWSRR